MTQILEYSRPPSTRGRVQAARALAVAFDLLQVALTPVTFEGAFSPVEDGIDVVAAVVLTWLVGFHIAFVPSFLVKLLPIADLAPTWTLATAIATAGKGKAELPGPPGAMPVLTAEVVLPRRRRRTVRSVVLFATVFAVGFVVGGLLILPHVWSGSAASGRLTYWEHNWPGALLGGGLGLWAVRRRNG